MVQEGEEEKEEKGRGGCVKLSPCQVSAAVAGFSASRDSEG